MSNNQRPIGATTSDDQQPPTTDQPVFESVKGAAHRLGITSKADRLRINRGTLPSEKIGDNWFLVVDDDQRPTTDQRPLVGQATTSQQSRPTTADASVNNRSLVVAERVTIELEAIRDEWLQPLINQICELEHDRGRLEADYDHTRRDADELRRRAEAAESRLSELEAIPAEAQSVAETQLQRP